MNQADQLLILEMSSVNHKAATEYEELIAEQGSITARAQ